MEDEAAKKRTQAEAEKRVEQTTQPSADKKPAMISKLTKFVPSNSQANHHAVAHPSKPTAQASTSQTSTTLAKSQATAKVASSVAETTKYAIPPVPKDKGKAKPAMDAVSFCEPSRVIEAEDNLNIVSLYLGGIIY